MTSVFWAFMRYFHGWAVVWGDAVVPVDKQMQMNWDSKNKTIV